MKVLRWAALGAFLLLAAACDEGDPVGLSEVPPDTTGLSGGRPSGDFPVWVPVGNSVGLNTRVNREAGFLELPDTVCWMGQFNGWSDSCAVWGVRQSAQAGEAFVLPVNPEVQELASRYGMVGRCGRVTYFWKRFPGQFFPVEEWISARGGLSGLTESQRRALAPEPGKPVTQTGAGLLPTVMIGSNGAQACSVAP